MGYPMPELNGPTKTYIPLEELVRAPMGRITEPITGTSDGATSTGTGPAPAPSSRELSRHEPQEISEEPDMSLIRDKSGNEHYIGPSGSLNFLSQLRKLVGLVSSESTATPASLSATPATSDASKFAQDATAQALEADADSNDKTSTTHLATQASVAMSLDPAPGGAAPEDTLYPGSVTSTVAGDFTRLPPADIGQILHQFPPDDSLEMLINSYFKNVHGDFPLFHRPTFEDEYELFVVQARRRPVDAMGRGAQRGQPTPNWGWLGCIHMIMVFGSISNPRIPGIDHTNLRRQSVIAARTLLPQLISKCTLNNVRVLLLLSVFLHNNNERNAAWNLVGTATRMSFALGMHRPSMLACFRPLEREVRKHVFCTLYSFEQFLASSLGRPSSLQDIDVDIISPCEGFLGGTSGADTLLTTMSLRLQIILSKTGQLYLGKSKTTEPGRPCGLDKIKDVLESLHTWKKDISQLHGLDLPWIKTAHTSHDEASCMGLDEIRASLEWKPRAHLRAVLLLHVQFHYIAIVVTRPILLQEIAARGTDDKCREAGQIVLSPEANACVRNACQLAQLVILLDSLDLVNGLLGLDIFYAYCATMVLILRLLAATPQRGPYQDLQPQETRQADEDQVQSTIRTLVSNMQSVINGVEKGGSMRRFARVIDAFFEVVNRPNSSCTHVLDGTSHSTLPRHPHHQPHPVYNMQTPYIQHQGCTLNALAESDMVSDGFQGSLAPWLGERAIGDNWLDFLPLSTFGGGSGSVMEEVDLNYEPGDGIDPQDWRDMQVLLGGHGGTG